MYGPTSDWLSGHSGKYPYLRVVRVPCRPWPSRDWSRRAAGHRRERRRGTRRRAPTARSGSSDHPRLDVPDRIHEEFGLSLRFLRPAERESARSSRQADGGGNFKPDGSERVGRPSGDTVTRWPPRLDLVSPARHRAGWRRRCPGSASVMTSVDVVVRSRRCAGMSRVYGGSAPAPDRRRWKAGSKGERHGAREHRDVPFYGCVRYPPVEWGRSGRGTRSGAGKYPGFA